MLAEMGLEYFDLLLIHWPGEADVDFGADPAQAAAKCSFSVFCEQIGSAWENMQVRVRLEMGFFFLSLLRSGFEGPRTGTPGRDL